MTAVIKDKVTRQIVAAIALIRDQDGKILVQRRNLTYIPKAYGKWEFPGGTVEYGESPYDTLHREVEEEIGCKIEIKRLLPQVKYNIWEQDNGVIAQAIVLCFECVIVDGIPQPSHREVLEIRWCTSAEALELDLLPGNDEFIKLLA